MKRSKKPIITTERLSLHSFTDRDLDNVMELLTNNEITKTYMVPDFESDDEVVEMFEILKRMSLSDERFVYGIYCENRLIGFINDVDISENEIEVGYMIHPAEKNKGFATEMLKKVIEELFDMEYLVVKAGAFEENEASLRVMEKCGMVRAKKEDNIEYRGIMHHCIYFEKRESSAE